MRAAAVAIIAALLAVVSLAAIYAAASALHIELSADPPIRLVRGIYPAERTEDGRVTFAWTGPDVLLRLPGLDRGVDWMLHVRLRGARQDARENPDVAFYADGVLLAAHRSTTDFQDIEVRIPARTERRRDTSISMRPSRTFTPGPSDPRQLGVMLDRVTLTPTGFVMPPRQAFLTVAAAAALFGAVIALLGVTTGSAIGGAAVIGVGLAAVAGRGFGPFTMYASVVLTLSIWIAIALLAVGVVIEKLNGQRLRNTARFALVFSAAALFLKLAVLLHPDMPVGDAMFHAHRFQDVLGGKLFFTSIAPGNYTFPYAPGFYVFAWPFSGLVRRGASDMALLRTIAMTVGAVAGGLLYLVVTRAWGERTAGAIAVAVYHLLPLEFRVITVANLTNAFAQSIAVIALALMAATWVRWERRWTVALLTIVFAAAFLSHTSTFAILPVAGVLAALMFFFRGGAALRSPALAIVVGVVAAVVIAIGLYYAHFGETYRAELARLGAETASAAPDAGGRGIAARLGSVPYSLNIFLGVPALALAAAGAWRLWQRGARDRLTLSIAGWALACLLFLVVGVLTPADFRYYLASLPAVAVVAATGAAGLWAARGYRRVAAAALLGWVVVTGIQTWWTTLSGW